MLYRFVCLLCIVGTPFLSGCGSEEAAKQDAVQPEEATAFDDFKEKILPLEFPADMGDWAGASKFVMSDEYAAAVDEFESAELTGSISGKSAERDALIAALRTLREKAEAKAPQDELQAAWQAYISAAQALQG